MQNRPIYIHSHLEPHRKKHRYPENHSPQLNLWHVLSCPSKDIDIICIQTNKQRENNYRHLLTLIFDLRIHSHTIESYPRTKNALSEIENAEARGLEDDLNLQLDLISLGLHVLFVCLCMFSCIAVLNV